MPGLSDDTVKSTKDYLLEFHKQGRDSVLGKAKSGSQSQGPSSNVPAEVQNVQMAHEHCGGAAVFGNESYIRQNLFRGASGGRNASQLHSSQAGLLDLIYQLNDHQQQMIKEAKENKKLQKQDALKYEKDSRLRKYHPYNGFDLLQIKAEREYDFIALCNAESDCVDDDSQIEK